MVRGVGLRVAVREGGGKVGGERVRGRWVLARGEGEEREFSGEFQ